MRNRKSLVDIQRPFLSLSFWVCIFYYVILPISIKESSARDVLHLAFEDKAHPQMSETLFYEYEEVMKRKKIQNLTPLTVEEQNTLFHAYLSSSKWNEIYYMWRPNLKDENDNFLVELAVASGVEYIITYNIKDFKIHHKTPA